MRQVVCRLTDGKVLRHGYCVFDVSAAEEMVESEFIFGEGDWFWDGATFNPGSELKVAKIAKMDSIDARTGALIGAGFVYDGKLFSESSTMQRNLLVLNARDLRSALSGLLPMVISTKDNMDEAVLSTVAEFLTFYNSAEIQGLTHYGSGNALKSQVRAITNDVGQPDVAPNYYVLADAIAAVEAIVDSR